ncbi:hypothetical protein KDJ21_015335 [Metabacillus litoralis]|uniref:hypothetical protein n=1 Tax=Metabacillus litoralis TaxID=152268 RepID=UPI001E408C3F|nr:hypothetical protein [Metabacillus litoralis]UHA58234.1 hypothetical protein KDJ21_015335 [Metabacillus litoralis]
MLKDIQYPSVYSEKKQQNSKQRVLDFIDGNGFDSLLEISLKALFYGMVFFCVPYLIYLIISLVL